MDTTNSHSSENSDKIIILKNNIYLFKNVNYTGFHTIYEWKCVSISKLAYKFRDKNREFWFDKNEFRDSLYGKSGYFLFECIYDHRETLKNMSLKNLANIRKIACVNCNDGLIICPGCFGFVNSANCAGCKGKGKVVCGKCNGKK